MEILIKGARVVDSSQDFIGDVYIKNGIIEEICSCIKKDCKIIYGEGLVLLPSFIDLHSHFRDPGFTYKEDLESGSHAAVRGGYTVVNLMANTNPVCSSMDIVRYVIKKIGEIGLVDVHQCVSITRDLKGEDTSHLDSIEYSVNFISDDGKGVSNSKVMYEAMLKAAAKNITVIAHAEFDDITPIDTRLSEYLMIQRDISFAKFSGCQLHVAHVSTVEAMSGVIHAKNNRCKVTCEVTPHHLSLTDDTRYKVNPPLRKKEDVDFLIKAIKEGFVDAIATDHAPHSSGDMINGISGISGIETSFSVCYTRLVKQGHITLSKLSEIMSKNPAGIMGLNKGEIKIGYEGDLVLVDINKKYVVSSDDFASKGKNTPFDGMEFYGVINMTLKGGRVVYCL